MPKAPTEEPSPPVSPGDLIASKYRIEQVLGSGGMAFVVAARHEDLGQLVAMKLLRPDLPDHEVAAGRFLREARAAARIQSDFVARVFDVGITENGHPYMVMEHLDGADLDSVLLSGGPMSITDATDHVIEALEAVAHAHALGIVHRDLKPANMFLASRPDGSQRVKVLDFGISKTNGLSSPAMMAMVTAPNALLGSPAYMSPEQARSSTTVDLRTDLWSIGVILYELITGRHPFDGDTAPRMLASIARDPPIPLRSVRPDAPATLEKVILRCLERDLDARFQNAAELAHALVPFASDRTRGLAARISLVLGAPPPPRASSTGAASAQMMMDEATADTMRSDDIAYAMSQAAAASSEDAAPVAVPAAVSTPVAVPVPVRTTPDPGTPSLQGSARDAAKDSSRAPSMPQATSPRRSAAKGRMISLGLIAVIMLAIGMIASAAWRVTGKILAAEGSHSSAPSPSAAPGNPEPLSSTTPFVAPPPPSATTDTALPPSPQPAATATTAATTIATAATRITTTQSSAKARSSAQPAVSAKPQATPIKTKAILKNHK